MQKINLLSALILFGSVQGVILAFALNHIKKRNRSANRILAIFILLISLVLLSRLVYVEGFPLVRQYPRLYLIPDIPLFLYGPLFYFYIRSLLNRDTITLKKSWLHFLPSLIHILIMSVYLFESREEYIRRLMQSDLIELPWAPFLAIFQAAVYVFYSYIIYRHYIERINESVSYTNSIKYLQTIFILITICWLAWLISQLGPSLKSILGLEFVNYNIAWVALSFTTFFLAYFAIVQQDIFRLPIITTKYEKSGLSSSQLRELQEKLAKYMVTQKPYLNPRLTLGDLAQMIGTTQKDLSRVINEGFGMNFFDFINKYRVDEFKELSAKKNYKNMTMLAIAFDAGFNSKTTFNTVFKKHTHLTPREFVNNL